MSAGAPTTGSTSRVIPAPSVKIYEVLTDPDAMGELSPENTGGRWVDGATEAAVGARFEGDNAAKLGPITLKKWTTISEVTEADPGRVFEFVSADLTTWRFELESEANGTRVTESFSHAPYPGFQGRIYRIGDWRAKSMTKGMAQTLERLEQVCQA